MLPRFGQTTHQTVQFSCSFYSGVCLVMASHFSGNPESCSPFLSALKLKFELEPLAFDTEYKKVVFALSLLEGCALECAKWDSEADCFASFKRFRQWWTVLRHKTDNSYSGFCALQIFHMRFIRGFSKISAPLHTRPRYVFIGCRK